MSKAEKPAGAGDEPEASKDQSTGTPDWLARRQESEQRGIDYAAEVLRGLGDDRYEAEEWVGRINRPRLPMKRIMPEIVDHFTSLGVVGAPSFTAREVGQLGMEICVDPGTRESVVYYILEKRRREINSPLVAPFVVVAKDHILGVAHDVEEKTINLDEIQNDQTGEGYRRLAELKVEQEDLEQAITSNSQRRSVRALHHILGEPTGISGLVSRIEKQVAQDGSIPLQEVTARTVNWVEHLHGRHSKIDLAKLRQEEYLIHLLEEGRIGRLRTLSRKVLLNSIDTIHLTGYSNGD